MHIPYTVNIIEKLEGAGPKNRNTMDFAAKQIRKIRETYWSYEQYGLNDRIRDEFKTDNKHINVTTKFLFLSRKHSHANRGKITKSIPLLLPQQLLNDGNHIQV